MRTSAVRRRAANLLVREVGPGTIVYDLLAEHVWLLDTAPAEVWWARDGARDAAGVASITGLRAEDVAAGVHRLVAAGLVAINDKPGDGSF